MRTFPDGTIWLPRKNPSLEAKLDKEYDRVPGELKWTLKGEDQGLERYRGMYKDLEMCYMVGKGPTLDHLTAIHFQPKLPIFCMNESIHKIEKLGLHLTNPLFCVQQDWNLRKNCIPKYGTHFLSRTAFTAAGNKDGKMYLAKMLGATGNSLSVDIAMRIAAKMGLKMCTFYGFDSCINKNTSYAKEIGYLPSLAGDPKRFLGHKVIIERTAKEFGLILDFIAIE